jgi:hypothetical protein
MMVPTVDMTTSNIALGAEPTHQKYRRLWTVLYTCILNWIKHNAMKTYGGMEVELQA